MVYSTASSAGFDQKLIVCHLPAALQERAEGNTRVAVFPHIPFMDKVAELGGNV
jgi:hypothetical protein